MFPALLLGLAALPWRPARAELQETSIVRMRFDPRVGPGLRALTLSAADSVAGLGGGPTEHAEVFGCPADLAAVDRGTTLRYRAVASGDGYLVLRRT